MNTNNKLSQTVTRAVIASLALAASSSALAVNNSSTHLKDAKDVPNVSKAFNDGNVGIGFRGRMQSVNDKSQLTVSGGRTGGEAYTLQTALKYNTAFWQDAALALEFVDVGSYFDDRHNQGQNLSPQASARPVISDAKSDTLNQAYVVLKGMPDTVITAGRQHLTLDSGRFIGTEYFRQTPTSFDAVTVTNNSYKDWNLFYAFVDRYNTEYKGSSALTGKDNKHESHLFNVTWSALPMGDLTGFAYLLEDKTTAANSADVYGLSFNGDQDFNEYKMLYNATYARQDAGHNNPKSYIVNYTSVGAGLTTAIMGSVNNAKLMVDYQVFGGEPGKSVAFTTPYAAKHYLNGFANKFSTTPNNGLKDLAVSLNGTWEEVDMTAVYHHFSAEDRGSLSVKGYGEEWNFGVAKTFRDRYSVGLEYADFNAKSGSPYANLNELWLTASAKFM